MSTAAILQDAVNKIKQLIEDSIITNGAQGKESLIRSSRVIQQIHEAVKKELIEKGVEPNRIVPALGQSNGELVLTGSFKSKSQDVCILPKSVSPQREILTDGFLKGKYEAYGKSFTEKTISINVRSQLSSLAKNFDTLYERTFAESLNLHMRCPKIVLGEVYLIPTHELSSSAVSEKQIDYVATGSVEKYILAFQWLNNRANEEDEDTKYERVSLIIVDFSRKLPKIYNSDLELKEDGLIPKDSTASIKELNFLGFSEALLKKHEERFR